MRPLETQSPRPHSIIIRHNKRFRKNILQFSKLFATGAGQDSCLVNRLFTMSMSSHCQELFFLQFSTIPKFSVLLLLLLYDVASGDIGRRGAFPAVSVPWLRWRVAARSLGRGLRAGAQHTCHHQHIEDEVLILLPDSSIFCDITHRTDRIRKGNCSYTFIRNSRSILYLLLWTYCGKSV